MNKTNARETIERIAKLIIGKSSEEREALAWSVLDHLPVGLNIIDLPSSKLLYMNEAYSTVHGWPPEALGDQKTYMKNVFPDEDQRKVAYGLSVTMLTDPKPGHRTLDEVRITTSEGEKRILQVTWLPIPEENLLVSMFVDQTARKQAEAEQMRLLDQLRQSQKLEAIGLLAGGLAHEINNMLTPVIGFSDMMLIKDSISQADKTKLEHVLKSGLHAKKIIQQLLAFARKQVLELKRVDLGDLIERNKTLLLSSVPENIQVEFKIASHLEPAAIDESQILQVVLNLVLNARDAIDGSGKIIVQVDQIEITSEQPIANLSLAEGRYLQISIRDTGRGIDLVTQEHIFDPFFTTKEQDKGTGLGLAMARGIAEQHGGAIQVDSQLGQGSTFRIVLPICSSGHLADALQIAHQQIPKGNGETILVVEDHPVVRLTTCQMLELLGYRVFPIEDAALFQNFSTPVVDLVDLLVTDLVLPGTSGKQIADTVRRHKPDIKVLYMSGYSGEVVSHQGFPSHELPLLKKPFTLAEIAVAVAQQLGT